MERVHGEECWKLNHGRVSLALTRRGGHLAPVEFDLGSRRVSPYALAPWLPSAADQGIPVLLEVLRGDFWCFPFGPQEGAPPHGRSANGEWVLEAMGEAELRVSMRDEDSGGVMEKIVSLRDGENCVYQEHVMRGVEGAYSYGTHPILDFSGLSEGEGRVSVSGFRWGSVYPGLFSDPRDGARQALEVAARFESLEKVPLAGGGVADLTRYPARRGNDDLVMMVNEVASEEQPFAWSAVTMGGYVWYALKDPADFPATLFWMSNGGRTAAPWNGRHLARLGIEEVCSYFCDGVDVSRENRLVAEGVKTVREFRRDEVVSLRVVQGVVEVPEGFGKVALIRPAGVGRIAVSDEAGVVVEAAVDWSFVIQRTQESSDP